jgi:hypothetical protein
MAGGLVHADYEELPMSFIHRRRFLEVSSASLALSTLGAYGLELVHQKPCRVGLIGAGWYGKSDLFRLIQVAPVEVVSVCDVDEKMLAEAAEMISQRQKSGRSRALYGDYREMLKEKDLDIVLIGTPDHWHALPMIEACQGRAPTFTCRSRSAWTSSRARRCSPPPASTTASCRSARSARARRT